MLLKDQKGQTFLELLIALPILLMVLFACFEFAAMFYNRAIIIYSTSVAAVKAATKGEYNGDIRQAQAEFLKRWTIGGSEYSYQPYYSAEPASTSEDTVYIYGTDKNSRVQRGGQPFRLCHIPYKVSDTPAEQHGQSAGRGGSTDYESPF